MAHIDILLRNGQIIDGTGNPWFYGDVAVAGDRIQAIAPPGQIPPDAAREVIDATGHVVCPGFIDIQSHVITSLMCDGRCVSKISQGVTTEIMGETWTPAPAGGLFPDPGDKRNSNGMDETWRERCRTWKRFSDWLEAMQDHGVSPNIGSFMSGAVVRQHAMGMAMGRPTSQQLEVMRRVMAQGMEEGAFGVSYALIYPPDVYAETDEVTEVAKVAGRHGGIYITHMRSEAGTILEALEEALEIGRRAELPVEIFHLKAAGRENWEKMPRVIERIDAARAGGQDVTADMYPYVASGTGLTAMLPTWTAEGGRLYERLGDPEERARIRKAVVETSGDWDLRYAEDAMPVGLRQEQNRKYIGMRLDEIARARGEGPVDTLIYLLHSEGQRIFTLYFRMSEDNLRLQLAQPWIKVASDASAYDPKTVRPGSLVHPRSYGTFTRVLGHYARQQKVLSLEEAVRKMTSSVANRLNLPDRGTLRSGAYADLVIFNPEAVSDRSTYDDPHQLSVGIREVYVNGQRVWHNGAHTGALPGRFVRPAGVSAARASAGR